MNGKGNMSGKERKQMLEDWVYDWNPKAYLRRADPRCGSRYAVAIKGKENENPLTEYMPLKELEQFLSGVIQSSKFLKAITLCK